MNPIHDWLNEFYSFYMAAIVGVVISRRGLTIKPIMETNLIRVWFSNIRVSICIIYITSTYRGGGWVVIENHEVAGYSRALHFSR